MKTCESGPPQRVYKATQYRDGLMIALLICCPMRLRNLTEIVIGRHLIYEGEPQPGYASREKGKVIATNLKTVEPTPKVDLELSIDPAGRRMHRLT